MRKVYHYRVLRLALLLLVGAPAFVAAGVLLLVQRHDNVTIWIVSIACILFFGATFLVGLVCVPRIMRNSEALILTPEALVMRQVGRKRPWVVPWTEIIGFSEIWIKGNHFVSPHLRKTPERIERECNALKRWWMKANTHIAGSPYNIPTNPLRCDPDELVATLVAYLEKYGRQECPGKEAQPGRRPLDFARGSRTKEAGQERNGERSGFRPPQQPGS